MNYRSNISKTILNIVKLALVMAIYIIFTVLLSPLSYGDLQFRFSEVLLILCFIDRKYGIALILGCAIANLFSPIPLDFIFGTLQTVVAVIAIGFIKKLWLGLTIAILSMIIVGAELAYVFDINLWITTLQVMFSEAILLFGIGYPLYILLNRNKKVIEMFKLEKLEKKNENI